MNKIIILVVVVILVGVGAYVFFNRSEPAPVNSNTNTDKTTNENNGDNKEITQETQKIFDISAKNYEFSVKEIKVKKGDSVTVNLTSSDGFHDFIVDELNARTTRIKTGEKTSVTFTADKTGTFEFYCSVGSHRQMGMKGTIIVE